MSQFSYQEYEKQQAERKANSSGNNKLNSINFVNSFLKNDGDTVTVRFPYKSMNDIVYESIHSVKFPEERYNKKVRCEGDNCPLCKSGVKREFRFFVKALVYQVDDDGTMKVIPAIWDRAAAFADIDIKNKMQQCADDDIGTLADNLVKIRKTGSGLETRYTLDIIAPTNKIYNSRTCPADFALLENIDPVKILTKSFEQYVNAMNGVSGKAQESKQEISNTLDTNDKIDDSEVENKVSTFETNIKSGAEDKETTTVKPTETRRPVRFSF